jgi:hypothetical protein
LQTFGLLEKNVTVAAEPCSENIRLAKGKQLQYVLGLFLGSRHLNVGYNLVCGKKATLKMSHYNLSNKRSAKIYLCEKVAIKDLHYEKRF